MGFLVLVLEGVGVLDWGEEWCGGKVDEVMRMGMKKAGFGLEDEMKKVDSPPPPPP